MASDQSTSCAITNQSGKDIMIAVALSGDESAARQAATSLNRQLKLLTFDGGGTVLKNGATGAITLDQSYKPGSGYEGAITNYDLVAGDGAWLYPLAHLEVAQQQSNGSKGYQAQTVTAANTQGIDQAINFYQAISAYPDSQLAADYMKAVEDAKAAALAKADGSSSSAQAVLDAMESPVRAFFQGTKEYKEVTLQDVAAVSSYYADFPFVWAQYKDSITYYLYGSDGEKAQFTGTLSLEKTGPADVQKANGGYTCLFTPAIRPEDTSKTATDAANAVPLTYINGLFVEDAAAASPKIGLKGGFMLKQFFTTKEEDTQVITVVAGTCNGVSCVGFDAPQRTKAKHATAMTAAGDTPVEKYWNALMHPKTQLDLAVTILTFIGAAAFIAINAAIIYKVYKFVKARRQEGGKLPADEVESYWKRKWSSPKANDVFFSEWVEGKGWQKVDFSKVRADLDAERQEMVRDKLKEGLDAQLESMDGILKFFREINTADFVALQEAAVDVNKSLDALDDASPETLKKVIAVELKAYAKRDPVIKGICSRADNIIKGEIKDSVDESVAKSAAILEIVENMQREDEAEIVEEDPIVHDPIRPFEWR